MSHKQHGNADRHPQCLPPLLSVLDPVETADGMRILKYQRRNLKADLVFRKIQPLFFSSQTKRIRVTTQMYIQNSTFFGGRQTRSVRFASNPFVQIEIRTV